MEERKYDLEDRFVDFTCRMIDIVETLPGTKTGIYIANELIRCSHSPALNYAEAQAAESPNDFIHELRVVLKELKECRVILKIIAKKELIKPASRLDEIFNETQSLIAIIAKSISTSKKKKNDTG